jgi:hypothetical protein
MNNGMYHGHDTITTTTRTHAGGLDKFTEIDDLNTGRRTEEISDSVALSIAAGWQSPAGVGRAMARLASTGRVGLEDLADDISASLDECRRVYGTDSLEYRELNLLATWALNHPSREG